MTELGNVNVARRELSITITPTVQYSIRNAIVTQDFVRIILFGEDTREYVFCTNITPEPFLFGPTVPMNKIRVGMSDSPNIRSGNVTFCSKYFVVQ